MRRHPNPLLAIAVGFCLTLFAFAPHSQSPSEPLRTVSPIAA